MGGFGSGPSAGYARPTVEDTATELDIDRLVRQGLFRIGFVRSGILTWTDAATGATMGSLNFFTDTIDAEQASFNLSYRVGPKKRSIECPIFLEARLGVDIACADLRYYQKARLARTLYGDALKDYQWEFLTRLNRVRNDLAHNLLPSEKFDRSFEALLKATCPPGQQLNLQAEPGEYVVIAARWCAAY
jgi:hypothetical protein